jgi:hypothetical protein
MWYTTTPEDQPVPPTGEVLARQQADSIIAPAMTVAERISAIAATTPGTEYWLP